MRTAALRPAVGALLLTALAVPPAGAAPEGPGTAEARGTAVAAARAAATGIAYGDCPADLELPPAARCGTLTVPLDYADPDGERIRLVVSRLPASGADPDGDGRPVPRQGSLVFNPGGPGGSGLSFPRAAEAPAWQRIAAAYDLVGYAPRGVAPSTAVSCRDPARFFRGPAQAPTHPSPAVKRERAAEAASYARGCAERTGEALRHVHSLNNARDLDVLRAALGERRLTFLGASYGTYLGALYAGLFPGHVRRLVFDSVVNPAPGQLWYRNNLAQSAAFEDRWTAFKTWTAAHDDVYGLGDTPGKVQDAYERASERLSARPAGGTVGPAQLHGAFLDTGYHDGYWPYRAAALSAYLEGDAGPLTEQAAPPGGAAAAGAENAAAVYTAVECNDAPWPTDFRVWDRDNTLLARTAPFETWDNVWTNLPCAFWPAPRQRPLDVRTPPGELPPTLLLAAEHDAATPYAGARELRRRLSGSVLVTERGAGTHGISGGPNACANAHLEAYLLRGRLPARDTSCAPRPEPSPLAAPAPAPASGPVPEPVPAA
ncbi:alpha/beta hydrolase [Streptomyces sp. AD55]|uniref:alpha/beta hydrolase n=1 Tax=Streptomyces sp. AD55 TaxID=3242895 RepID=UPI003526FF44